MIPEWNRVCYSVHICYFHVFLLDAKSKNMHQIKLRLLLLLKQSRRMLEIQAAATSTIWQTVSLKTAIPSWYHRTLFWRRVAVLILVYLADVTTALDDDDNYLVGIGSHDM